MLDIPSFILGTKNVSSGSDISEYIDNTISGAGSSLYPSFTKLIKKLPDLNVSGNSLRAAFCEYNLDAPIPKVNASNVINFKDCFNSINRYTGPSDLDLSGWTFPNRINDTISFESAFANNLSITGTINLSSMGDMTTGNILMLYAFQKNNSVKKINLSNFKYTGIGVVDVHQMFYNCSSLEEIDMSSFDFVNTNLNNKSYMFTNVPTNCLILVKDQDQVDWFATEFPTMTNVQIKS